MLNLETFYREQVGGLIDEINKSNLKKINTLTDSDKNFRDPEEHYCLYPLFIALSSIQTSLIDEKLKKDLQHLTTILIKQKSSNWSFNYWVKNSKDYSRVPYPDDLDDTSYALAALHNYDSKKITGALIAKYVNLLTRLEKQVGGPYKTWLVGKGNKEWEDIDIAVNSNIAYFLSLLDVNLPNVNAFIDNVIQRQNYYSPYYYKEYPVVFFISRFYKGPYITKLLDYLLRIDISKLNSLELALLIISLKNLGHYPGKLESSIKKLIKLQKSGDWNKPYPFIVEKIQGNKKYYSGSSIVTKSFCLEALGKFIIANTGNNLLKTESLEHIRNRIIKLYRDAEPTSIKRFNLLRDKALNTINNTEVFYLATITPYSFYLSIAKKKKIPQKTLDKLGLANLYGWLAYKIYDDFYDDEGNKESLPLANYFLRELTLIYKDVCKNNTEALTLFREIMTKLDISNLNKDLSLKNISKIADKSIAHALGPILITLLLGYKKDSMEVKSIFKFFRAYLTARQINDDLHDWEDDYEKKHASPIIWLFKSKKIDISKYSIEKRRELFWKSIVADFCELIVEYCNTALEEINKTPLIKHPKYLEPPITKLKQMAENTLRQRKTTLDFIKVYENKN